MVAQLHGTMIKMENFQKLHELKKDLIGIDNLVVPGRVSSRCWSNVRGLSLLQPLREQRRGEGRGNALCVLV